jgi:hypothetical protein
MIGLGLLAPRSAAADSELAIAIATATSVGLSPVDIILGDSPGEYYAIANGASGGCGSFFKMTKQSNGKYKIDILIKFALPGACNPIKLDFEDTTNGVLEDIWIYTQNGYVRYPFLGGTVTFSGVSVDNAVGGSFIAAPPPSSFEAAPAATIAETVYITTEFGGANGFGSVYQSTVSSKGALSPLKLIFSFSGGVLGLRPLSAAIVGPGDALYGVTEAGGNTALSCGFTGGGCGVVYKLTPKTVGTKTIWSESVLYTFQASNDDAEPAASLIFDGKGNLYGTTQYGGDLHSSCQPGGPVSGCGVVFMLKPGKTTPWSETVLYAFSGEADGGIPLSDLARDADGNVYGTAFVGGNIALEACTGGNVYFSVPGCGVVFELMKPTTVTSNPRSEKVLYAFKGGKDGSEPEGGPVVLGSDGTIFGTTVAGGDLTDAACTFAGLGGPGCGVVFELTPK